MKGFIPFFGLCVPVNTLDLRNKPNFLFFCFQVLELTTSFFRSPFAFEIKNFSYRLSRVHSSVDLQ